jgi:hypothetical protein
MMQRIRNDESGQVLVIALGFLAFIGVVAVVLLNYATTNVRATTTFRAARAVDYAGDGAVEGAINKLRHNPLTETCTAGNIFYLTTLNDQKVAVECVPQVINDGEPDPELLEVRATFTARCWVDAAVTTTTGPPPCLADQELLVARVLFREAGEPLAVRTIVESWSVK